MSGFKKSVLVVLGAIGLSALGLQASDTLRGLDTQLSGLVSESGGVCGAGAVQLLLGSHVLCVDAFEAAPASTCPVSNPGSSIDTQTNINEFSCVPESRSAAMPWRFVSLTQAQQLCARTGKRLPTNEEWYKLASGLIDQSACVVNAAGPLPTGSADCSTPAGVHDVVGNVWEWIEGQTSFGSYDARALPAAGYVSMVDINGVVVETSGAPVDEFGRDYAWTKSDAVYGIIRGGYFDSQDDAGIFAQNLSVPLDFKTAGVGFRCVRDI